jgi:hypothetical protein
MMTIFKGPLGTVTTGDVRPPFAHPESKCDARRSGTAGPCGDARRDYEIADNRLMAIGEDEARRLRFSGSRLSRRRRRICKNGVQLRHHRCSLADRPTDSLDRPRTDIADGEHAEDARFQRSTSVAASRSSAGSST